MNCSAARVASVLEQWGTGFDRTPVRPWMSAIRETWSGEASWVVLGDQERHSPFLHSKSFGSSLTCECVCPGHFQPLWFSSMLCQLDHFQSPMKEVISNYYYYLVLLSLLITFTNREIAYLVWCVLGNKTEMLLQALPLIGSAYVRIGWFPSQGQNPVVAKLTVTTSQMPGSLCLPLVFPKVMPQWVLAQLWCVILIPIGNGAN